VFEAFASMVHAVLSREGVGNFTSHHIPGMVNSSS
jgi:hypothetical protein